MENIKCIFFDLMGVVFTEPHIITNLLYPVLPYPKDYDFIKQKYEEYVVAKMTNREFWEAIKIKKWKSFEKEYLNKFEIDSEFEFIINYLKSKYKLAVLSDMAKEWGVYLIQKHNLNAFFDLIMLSGNYGIGKKDLKFFKFAIKNSGFSFNECCMIDDRLRVLDLASKSGMKTVWLEREKDKTKFVPDYHILKLNEIKSIV